MGVRAYAALGRRAVDGWMGGVVVRIGWSLGIIHVLGNKTEKKRGNAQECTIIL